MSVRVAGLLAASLGLVLAPGAKAAPPAATQAETPADASATPEAEGRLILAGGRLLIGDGTEIASGSLVIEDGRIVEVRAGEVAAQPGDRRVDLGGKLVTPGLIAADTQLGLVEIGLEPSTRDDARSDDAKLAAGYDPAAAINADSSLLAVQAIEGVTTAAVAPTAGLLAGQVAWIDLLPGDHAGLVAKPRIAAMADLADFGGSRAAALSELRKVFEDARWYLANREAFDRGQARELAAHPLDLSALEPVLSGAVPLVVRAHRASDLLAVIELAEAYKLRATVLGATEAWKVREQLAAAGIHVVLQPTHNLPASFDRLGARLDNAALLHEAGVAVAIAHFDTHNVRNLTQEAGIAVANGLPPEAALPAVTLRVAEAYGMGGDYGTLAAGKVASLVVWEGDDPFELSGWPEQVYVRGRALSMSSRQTQLRDRYLDLERFSG